MVLLHGLAAVAPDRSARLFGDLLPWLLVLIGAIILGGVVILLLRRRLASDKSSLPLGFTLHDLRRLHASGELSDEEFESARQAMIARVRTDVAPRPSTGALGESSGGGTTEST